MLPFMAKRYPESVKQSVCKQILDGSYFLAEIAKMNNIAYSTLFR
jgi:transposase-like protein